MLNNTQEITMTTEQYLQKKQQKELDRLFDEAIKEQREKELSKQMEQQKKIYEANLIKTLCDIECELDICEQIMSDQYNDIALIQDIKKEYKRLKTKYTKTKHELDIFCMNNM